MLEIMTHSLEVQSVTNSSLSQQPCDQIERTWKFHVYFQDTTLNLEIIKIKNKKIFEIRNDHEINSEAFRRCTSFEKAFKQVYSDLKNIHEITIHLPPLTPALIKQCKMVQTFHIKDTGERPIVASR